ncbi:ABC transporter permease [Alicyclobacillus vulcanalis]|nr:ABC transporter permease [Alicyclobacillus vulcanalis]
MRARWLSARLNQTGALLALILLAGALSLASPAFRTWGNIQDIVVQASIVAIMAAGQTFVIGTGGIDLSVGSIVGLSGVISAMLMSTDKAVGGMGHGVIVAVLAGLGVGAVVGLFNGLAVAKLGMAPFIVTLGTMEMVRGLAYVLTQGETIDALPNAFNNLATNTFLGVSDLIWITIGVYVICWILLSRTLFGKYTLSIGGNEFATRLSGVRVDRVIVGVYVLSGVLSALAGILLDARLQSGISTNGDGYELDTIAGVVIGGTSLSGGSASMFGSLVGVLIMSCVRDGLTLLNVNTYWSDVVMGLIIVLAVLTDILRKRLSVKRWFRRVVTHRRIANEIQSDFH